jgi:O-antigen ligase
MHLSPVGEWWRPDVWDAAGEARPAAAESTAQGGAGPFWSLMALTGVLLVAPQTFIPALASMRIALLTTGLAIAACLCEWFFHGNPPIRPTRELVATGCLVGWAVLTTPLSMWPAGSLAVLSDMYLKSVVVFWLLSRAVDSPRRLSQIAWGLSLMTVPLALAAVLHFRSGEALMGRIVGYEGSLMANPNDLALVLNLVLPLSVALLLSTERAMARAALVGVMLLDVIAVVVTFSRAGFLALATTALVYQWKLRRRPERVWALAALMVVGCALPILPSGYLDRLSTVTNMEADRTGSAQERWKGMVTAVRLVGEHPVVGAGVGLDVVALTEAGGPAWREVHNVYLEYAVDLGLPGLALFLALLVWSLRSATLVRRRAAGRVSFLAEGIETSLVVFAVAGCFYPVAYHFYFYYVAGLAAAAKAVWETDERRGPAPPRVEPC